ncbi:MAG: hypothetical protein HY905_05350 [Deltaproteobacteria bacterium]|nr:hypothetical protein [Deltaproteobacteria bacterium]
MGWHRSFAVWTLASATLVPACCGTPPQEPVSPPPQQAVCDPAAIPEPAWADEVLSAGDAARILREAQGDPEKAESLAKMREIFYVADLSWASGSEASAERLLRRFEREFENPRYLSAEDVQTALADMRRIADAYPPPPPPDDPQATYYGWNKVEAMLEPVEGLLPTVGEAFDELLRMPQELVLPFLVDQYFTGDFYHPYNMSNRLFTLLTTSGFGYEVLGVVEARLEHGDPGEGADNIYGLYWSDAVGAAREILGPEFDDWYCRVHGNSFDEDRVRHARAGD